MSDRILLVDDDPDFLSLLSLKLKKTGYEIITCMSGREALELAESIMPEVILLDVTMPDMDGFEVKERLNKNFITSSIPVLFLSANNATDAKVKGLQIGADDYISKPFATRELIERINVVLKKKKHYEKMSMTDSLTNLYNQGFFKKHLLKFFTTAKKHNKIFSLILLDINNFKQINDTYGHSTGDSALKAFSSVISKHIRESDILARYGGDEFVILLPNTDSDQINLIGKRFKEKIQKEQISIAGNKNFMFSVSIGVATYNKNYDNELDLFNHADKRLYEDKNTNSK